MDVDSPEIDGNLLDQHPSSINVRGPGHQASALRVGSPHWAPPSPPKTRSKVWRYRGNSMGRYHGRYMKISDDSNLYEILLRLYMYVSV